MKAIVKMSWIALFSSVAPARPAALPDSEARKVERSRVRPTLWTASDCSMTSSIPLAVVSHVKLSARASAASLYASRRGRSASRSRTPSTSSSGSSASRPVWSWTMTSERPPTRSAAVGVRHAPASTTLRHQPSADEAVEREPRAGQELLLLLLADVPVEGDAVGEAPVDDLLLERLALVAVPDDVERALGQRGDGVEDPVDPLVLLEAPEVDERRRLGLLARLQDAPVQSQVDDVDAVALDAELLELLAGDLRDREDGHAGVQVLERDPLARRPPRRARAGRAR